MQASVRRLKLALTIVMMPAAAASGFAAASASEVTGLWLDGSGRAGIEIVRCGTQLCGRIRWLREPQAADGRPKADVHNENPALRSRPLCGVPMLEGFVPAGPDSWEDGRIYNPEDGATYHATLRLQSDGTLRVRGYVGVPLFGKSQIWSRPATPLPACTVS